MLRFEAEMSASVWCFRKSPRSDSVLEKSPEVTDDTTSGSGRRILCRACGFTVTSEGDRIPMEGRHIHRRINPAGIEHEFGCFRRAPGAAVLGQPTTEHTWFPGYAWLFSVCRSCGTHLGWCFEGPSRFHGLILDRLETEPEQKPAH